MLVRNLKQAASTSHKGTHGREALVCHCPLVHVYLGIHFFGSEALKTLSCCQITSVCQIAACLHKQQNVMSEQNQKTHAYINTCDNRPYLCMHACMHACKYRQTRIHTNVHTYIRTYIHRSYIHMHTHQFHLI